jgi:uncharacterized alkaline shock family protein YloU
VNEEERMPENGEKNIGTVRIDNDVLGAIAAIAAKKVSGVHKITTGLVDGIAHLFRKNPDAGVKVVLNEGEVSIELGIIVEYGANIPETTWKVQKGIKDELENQSGFKVVKVNVMVEGVHYPEEDGQKEKGGAG